MQRCSAFFSTIRAAVSGGRPKGRRRAAVSWQTAAELLLLVAVLVLPRIAAADALQSDAASLEGGTVPVTEDRSELDSSGGEAISGASRSVKALDDRPPLTFAFLDTLINPLDAFTLQETVRSLQEALPQYRLRTIVITAAEGYEHIRAARPDFLFAPAGFSVQASLEGHVGSFRIATRRTTLAESASASVGAAFIVRRDDRRITDLASMRGLRAGASIPQAIDGWVAASGEILAHGFDPETFFRSIDFSNNAYPDVLSSLLAGRIDVGVVPACLLETSSQMHLVDVSNLRVVNEKREGLACRHSTALYPDVSLIALTTAPERAVRDVTVALLTLSYGSPTQNGGSAEEPDYASPDYEWVTNVSDLSVQRLLQSLRIGPYAYLRDMSLSALFMRYRTECLTACLLVLLLLLNEWRLHRTVRRRTADLQAALDKQVRTEAEAARIRSRLAGLEKRSIVQQMSGMIAHEINTPVGVVRNYAAFLRVKLGIRPPEASGTDDSQPRMSVETVSETDRKLIASAVLAIDREVVRISGIIARVRAYAKSTLAAHSPCELGAIIERSIAAFRAEAVDPLIVRCRVDFEPFIGKEGQREAWILGNPLELEILFLNLLRNGAGAAVTGMKHGAQSRKAERGAPFVTIRVERSETPVHSVKEQNDRPAKAVWRVIVENSGDPVGDEAFEVLERLGDSVAVAPTGLGLGLTICRGIADSHGADLHFERRSAGGVRATVIFEAEGMPTGSETEKESI